MGSRIDPEVSIPEAKPKGKEIETSVTESMMADRLVQIVEAKRREVASLGAVAAELRVAAEGAPPPRRFAAALRSPAEVRLLAEIKRRSPSAGMIRENSDPAEAAQAYEAGGAAALSVLTDAEFFGGSLDALRRAREAVDIPVLRKDFVIDPVQVWEARAAGADAILLIVRILSDALLSELHALAKDLDLDVLVEVHDRTELERALGLGATLVGINNRDLSTFRTDLCLSLELAGEVDPRITLIAESGISTPADVQRLGACGLDAVLVGESLMRQADLQTAAAALSGHPRNPLIRMD